MACYSALKSGLDVRFLLNTVSAEYNRVRFHGLQGNIIDLQAQALGIPLKQVKTRDEAYEADYKNGLKELLSENQINGVVFGDIHLQHCKEWAEKVSGELGLVAIEPLWNKEPGQLLAEFIKKGFEAYVVSCEEKFLDKSFIGRKIDGSFVEDISNLNVDVCGENGEFHSFVTDGPIFKKRIEIVETGKVKKGLFWFLDIKKCMLVDKNL